MGEKGKLLHILKSLKILGVSSDRTKIKRGWDNMASMLRDGNYWEIVMK